MPLTPLLPLTALTPLLRSLWKTMGWMSVPGMALISFFLLGIDEIGIQIEEPFGILPLEGITNTIANNIDELARSQAQVSVRYRLALFPGADRVPRGERCVDREARSGRCRGWLATTCGLTQR